MKPLHALILLACIVATVQTMDYNDEVQAALYDPMPMAHGGLGCMTDSECEGLTNTNEVTK